MSRLCQPVIFGLAIIALSRDVESLVPIGHPRVDCSWMSVVRTPRKTMIAFGADETNSSEPGKGLKEGVFEM